jgi:hypothetical protein
MRREPGRHTVNTSTNHPPESNMSKIFQDTQPDHELQGFESDRYWLIAAICISLCSVSACAFIIISWLI